MVGPLDSFRKGSWSPERPNTWPESWGFQPPNSWGGEEAGHWIPACGQWCNHTVLPTKWNPHKSCRQWRSEEPPGLWTLWCSGVVSADSMGRGLRSFAFLPRPQPRCILYNKTAIVSVLSWVPWVILVNLTTWGVCESPPEFKANWSKMWVAWGPTGWHLKLGQSSWGVNLWGLC